MNTSQSKVSKGGLVIAAIVVIVAIKGIAFAIRPSVKASDLRPYTDTAGAFSAKFPGTPKLIERPTAIPGVSFKMHAVEIGDTVLAVAYFDLPEDRTLEGNEQAGLTAELQAFAKSLKAKPKGATRKFELQEMQAQEARFEAPGVGELIVRLAIREDRRLYRVVYMSKSFDEAVGRAFVDSFVMDGEL